MEDASLPETAHERAIIDNYKLIIGQLLIQHYRKKHVNLMGVLNRLVSQTGIKFKFRQKSKSKGSHCQKVE